MTHERKTNGGEILFEQTQRDKLVDELYLASSKIEDAKENAGKVKTTFLTQFCSWKLNIKPFWQELMVLQAQKN